MLPALTWWRNSAAVSIDVGQAEHAGRLRIQAGGTFRIMGETGKLVSKGRANAPSLQIPLPNGLPAAGLPRQGVAWEVLGDALIVTLPWSGVTGVAKPAQASAKPVVIPATLKPPAPAPRPVTAAATSTREQGGTPVPCPMQRAILRTLHARGGRIRGLDGLSNAGGGVLRTCEDHGWATFSANTWSLTPAGTALVEDQDSQAAGAP